MHRKATKCGLAIRPLLCTNGPKRELIGRLRPCFKPPTGSLRAHLPWNEKAKANRDVALRTIRMSSDGRCNDPEGRACHKITGVLRRAANRDACRKGFDHRTR